MTTAQLPPEVWGRIFEYTCTDDGTMGRSLSLVSRLFNYASAPYKFQSVSVKPGHFKYILKFFEILQNAPPIQRRVRYLCLGNNGIVMSDGSSVEGDDDPKDGYTSSDAEMDLRFKDDEDVPDSDGNDEEPSEGGDNSDTEFTPLSSDELQDLSEDKEFFKSPEAANSDSQFPDGDVFDMTKVDILMLDTIHSILELCSETIQTLSVSIRNFDECRWHAFIFPKIRLPLLQELTWVIPINFKYDEGLHGLSRIHEPDPPSRDHPVLFPSLKSFHLDFPIGESYKLWIEHCCPDLRYLRTKFQIDSFETAIQKAIYNQPPKPRGTILDHPVEVTLHTPSTVRLHLIDLSLEDDWADSHMPDYNDICMEYGVGDKCSIDNRVKLTVKRKDDWKMTERDWKKRSLGKLGKAGFRWKHIPSYDEWHATYNRSD